MKCEVKKLGSEDLDLINAMLDCFGIVFEEPEIYIEKKPSSAYLKSLLGSSTFIALVATVEDSVVGCLAAYELRKFEQERSEIYIYDLAVYQEHRRQGIATRLIERTKDIARERSAWVVYVQADYIDTPAVNLYSKLGIKEEVMHFDLTL